MNKTLALLVLIAGMLCGCSGERDRQPARQSPGAQAEGPQYVGSQRCGACHARNYNFWKGTRHRNMLSEPSRKSIAGDFTSNSTVSVPVAPDTPQPLMAVMSMRDGSYHVVVRSGGSAAADFTVAYALGGTRRQMYLAALPDGRLLVLPVQWNVAQGRWEEAHGPDGATLRQGPRDWLKDCASCHVTGFSEAAAKGGSKTPWAENGVACEACHGPGASHANAKNPEKPDTIFNPGNFHDDVRANMVCGNCHTRAAARPGNPPHPRDYLPGDDSRRGFVEATTGDTFWPDGSPRANRQQYIDFRRSQMYAKGLRCWSCHSPHKSSENSNADLRLAGNALCRSCHTVNEGPRSLTHALHDNGSCVACHMPPTGASAAPGDIASHTFRPIPPSATLALGGGDIAKQPNSCNLCHYHRAQKPTDLDKALKIKPRLSPAAQPRVGNE